MKESGECVQQQLGKYVCARKVSATNYFYFYFLYAHFHAFLFMLLVTFSYGFVCLGNCAA